MIDITIDEITPASLKVFWKIFARTPDDVSVLVWDSHRLLPAVAPTSPGALVQHAWIDVASAGASDLAPTRQKIAAAGGTRGLSL